MTKNKAHKPQHRSSYAPLHKLWVCFVFAFSLFMTSFTLQANESDVKDHNLKAVYLFRFAFLTNWNEFIPTDKRYNFCAESLSDVSNTLKKLIDTKPDNATFIAFNVSQSSELSRCHIVYTIQKDPQKIAMLKKQMPHALLVGEGKEFIQAGGMIAFIKRNNRIKPLINIEQVTLAGLSLRSQLLSVSDIVKEETR